MSTQLPWYKMYPADADTDENFRALTNEELGLYWRCLNHAWINHGLPGDPDAIATVLRENFKNFRKSWKRLEKCFQLNSEGRYVNQRQEEERQVAYNQHYRKSEGGKLTASKRQLSLSLASSLPDAKLEAYHAVRASDSGSGSSSRFSVSHHHQPSEKKKEKEKELLKIGGGGQKEPRVFSSPADELNALHIARTNEPIKITLRDAIAEKLGGSVTAEFVEAVRTNNGNFKNFSGFIRDLANKFHLKSLDAGQPKEAKYQCALCGSKVPGEGLRMVDGEAVACSCADAGYITRQQKRGILRAAGVLA